MRNASIQNPSVFVIMTFHPVLHSKTSACVEGPAVLQKKVIIVGVNSLRPTISELLVNVPAGEFKPRSTYIRAELISAAHPYHHRCCVGQIVKPFLAFAKLCLCAFAIGVLFSQRFVHICKLASSLRNTLLQQLLCTFKLADIDGDPDRSN